MAKDFKYKQDFIDISTSEILSVVDLTTRSMTGEQLKLEDFPLEQDATILFTSGSSWEPKAILHTIGNHYYSALGSNQNILLQSGDRWLLSLPLYHVGGISIIFRTLLSGTTLAIPESKKSIAQNTAQLQPSHLSLVATQFFRLLSMPGVREQLQGMKAILLGGGSIPDRLIQKAYQNNLPIFISYGSTEMASQITATRPGDSFWNLKTSGKLLAHRDLTFAVDGEILVKGLTLFKGYLKKKRLLDQRDPEGWFHTADIGYNNENGYLIVTGRKDNMFISGGENIQPEEIESALKNIEGVEEVVVVPVPHHEYGQRPVAFIKISDGRQIKTYQLKNHLEKILPKYKIPEHFLDWPSERGEDSLKLKRELFKNIAIRKLSEKHL
jgi:O-succinylbenzoic acid--CoA ligase